MLPRAAMFGLTAVNLWHIGFGENIKEIVRAPEHGNDALNGFLELLL